MRSVSNTSDIVPHAGAGLRSHPLYILVPISMAVIGVQIAVFIVATASFRWPGFWQERAVSEPIDIIFRFVGNWLAAVALQFFLWSRRFNLGVAGLLACMLAVIGIYAGLAIAISIWGV